MSIWPRFLSAVAKALESFSICELHSPATKIRLCFGACRKKLIRFRSSRSEPSRPSRMARNLWSEGNYTNASLASSNPAITLALTCHVIQLMQVCLEATSCYGTGMLVLRKEINRFKKPDVYDLLKELRLDSARLQLTVLDAMSFTASHPRSTSRMPVWQQIRKSSLLEIGRDCVASAKSLEEKVKPIEDEIQSKAASSPYLASTDRSPFLRVPLDLKDAENLRDRTPLPRRSYLDLEDAEKQFESYENLLSDRVLKESRSVRISFAIWTDSVI